MNNQDDELDKILHKIKFGTDKQYYSLDWGRTAILNWHNKQLGAATKSDEYWDKYNHTRIDRLVLKAKIEVCDKYLSYRAASDTEGEAIQWLAINRDELRAEFSKSKEEGK